MQTPFRFLQPTAIRLADVVSIFYASQIDAETRQFKRDLIWAVTSAPLLKNDDCSDKWELAPEQIDGEQLVAFLRERAEHRVGHYFENLIHFWLIHIRRVRMLAHRLPVRDENRTLGELDFVFRDEQDRLNHWEVAVKFYLQTLSTDRDVPQYLGPNTTDSLNRKITRMQEHQLPLSRHVYEDVEIRHAFVKGRLYAHRYSGRDVDVPTLHPNHLRGVWLHANEVDNRLGELRVGTQGFAILEKPFWLTSAGSSLPMEEFDATVQAHFTRYSTAIHVALLDEDGEETNRLFVVPEHWPDLPDR